MPKSRNERRAELARSMATMPAVRGIEPDRAYWEAAMLRSLEGPGAEGIVRCPTHGYHDGDVPCPLCQPGTLG